jgi:UDPglucose 6-dehydrogenase
MTKTTKAPVIVVGAGYVGLITALKLAESREVRIVDTEEELIESLRRGTPPFYEPGLLERLRDIDGRIVFTTSLDKALADGAPRFVFVAVGTPTYRLPDMTQNGIVQEGRRQTRAPILSTGQQNTGAGEAADLRQVRRVMHQLPSKADLVVVMKSTVPPGTGDTLLREARAQGRELLYVSCPEFLQEGTALECVDSPNRIVVGAEESASKATAELRALHEELYPGLKSSPRQPRYMEMDITSAELVKHASNLKLALRISYANEMANICEQLGADIHHVMDGVGADARIGPEFLRPSVGFGGSCLGKDVLALSHTAACAGVPLSLADTALEINQAQSQRAVSKLAERLGNLAGTEIALLGLAFKPGTSDTRASPALRISELLLQHGARVRAFDPQPGARDAVRSLWSDPPANSPPLPPIQPEWTSAPTGVLATEPDVATLVPEDPALPVSRAWTPLAPPPEVCDTPLEALKDADAVVVVTAWPDFRALDWRAAAQAMRGRHVLDGPNVLDAQTVRDAGLIYEGTGRHSAGLRHPTEHTAGE